jgi:cell division protein FtsQ
MIRSINIKRILFVLFWAGIAVGMGFLINAAWKKQGKAICKGYVITRNDDDSFVFIKKQDVEAVIRLRAGGSLLGQSVDRFPLQRIEDSLKKFIGVSDAQAYFDNRSILYVRIQERIPVARVFTTLGTSFYLDSTGRSLPLSDQVVIECPVFNGLKWENGRADSLQSMRIVALARCIQADSFWSAQVGHFEIDEKGRFELIPVAGNHRVQFGTAEDPAAAFHRLWIFYQQVLRPRGLDTYPRIDVQYQGQVVASRNRYTAESDSTRQRKQVDALIQAGMKSDSTIQITKPIKRAT